MEVYKFLPKVRGGAQRAEGSVVEGQLLYYCRILFLHYFSDNFISDLINYAVMLNC